ncbi:hypothetical protein [Microbulbifer halophilus]|uniref:hypothetical protein n=1 Tax=Microbulbifer halophilus TaxID=453963 RepID=UPI0036238739
MAQAGAGCAFLGLSARGAEGAVNTWSGRDTSRTSLQGRIDGVSQKGAPRSSSLN